MHTFKFSSIKNHFLAFLIASFILFTFISCNTEVTSIPQDSVSDDEETTLIVDDLPTATPAPEVLPTEMPIVPTPGPTATSTPVPDSAPVTAAISPPSFNANSALTITLDYSDNESNLATACALSGLSHITITTPCACDGAGVCTVQVTGDLNYVGSAGFNYTVTANGITSDSATATLTINNVATFAGGWTHVKALGTKSAIATTDAPEVAASVVISFAAMTVLSGSIESYNIYRDTDPGLDITASTQPYAEGISTATLSFTDGAVASGTTYYYQMAPVVSGIVVVPNSASDKEIKIVVPPPNMALVHRWVANREMCGLMAKAIDRANNYRCIHTGPGSSGGYFDLGNSLLVDAFETGCNYSTTACSGGPCIGTASPAGVVTAATNTVYYNRGSGGGCFINTNGGTTWMNISDATMSSARRTIMASNRPGLPSISTIGQVESQSTCAAMSEAGFAGTKRLLHRKEWVIAAAWDSSLSDAIMNTMEDGTGLPTTGYCNSRPTNGLTFDNLTIPADKETLPGTSTSGIKSVIGGSNATRNCVSRYGIQDMVGNVEEWNSDQINLGVGVVSTADAENSDFDGLLFNNINLSTSIFFTTTNKILLPFGLSAVSLFADGVVDWSATPLKFHGDDYRLYTSTRRGVSSGNYWFNGPYAGRFAVRLEYLVTRTTTDLGLRCVLALPAD